MRSLPFLAVALLLGCTATPHNDSAGLAGAGGASGATGGRGGGSGASGQAGAVGGAQGQGGTGPVGQGGKPAQACVPGQSVACACSSGAMGAQTCRPDGSGYDPCQCQSGGVGGATGGSGSPGCVSAGGSPASGVSPECQAYYGCLSTACEDKRAACYAAGGPCAAYSACVDACACNPTCIGNCNAKYTADCSACVTGYSQCSSEACMGKYSACYQSNVTCLKQVPSASKVDASKCFDIGAGDLSYEKWCSSGCATPPKAKLCSSGYAPDAACVGLSGAGAGEPVFYCCP
jgi:hypothetical protein